MSSSAEFSNGTRVLRNVPALHLQAAETVTAAEVAAERTQLESGGDNRAEQLARARAEGYAEGHAAGLAEARDAIQLERTSAINQAVACLQAGAATVAGDRQELVLQVTAEAVELAYELARAILSPETVAAALPLAESVARALELAPEGADLVVRIPPGFALSAADLATRCGSDQIVIREDPAIEPGGCVLEAGACRIDTQVSTALERVRKVLAEARGGWQVT